MLVVFVCLTVVSLILLLSPVYANNNFTYSVIVFKVMLILNRGTCELLVYLFLVTWLCHSPASELTVNRYSS